MTAATHRTRSSKTRDTLVRHKTTRTMVRMPALAKIGRRRRGGCPKIHPDLSHDQGQKEELEELPSTLEDLLLRETKHDAEEDDGIDDVSRTQEVEVDLGHLLRRLSQDDMQIRYNPAEEFADGENGSRLGLLLDIDRAEWDGEQLSSYDDEVNNSTIQDLIYQDGKRLDLSTDDRASRSPLELSPIRSPQLG